GRLDGLAGVDSLFRRRLDGRHRRGAHLYAMAGEGGADARPVGVDQHAAGIEEHGLNRHGFSLHLSVDMTARRALLVVAVIAAVLVTWAAARFARQFDDRGEEDAVAADAGESGERATLRFFRNPATAPAFT